MYTTPNRCIIADWKKCVMTTLPIRAKHFVSGSYNFIRHIHTDVTNFTWWPKRTRTVAVNVMKISTQILCIYMFPKSKLYLNFVKVDLTDTPLFHYNMYRCTLYSYYGSDLVLHRQAVQKIWVAWSLAKGFFLNYL